jgi:hypothetical protein
MTLPNESDAGYTEATARKAYRLLHHHATNGYERGDCHCEACGVIVEDLADWFGFTPATNSDARGIYDPAALVRDAARERGWQ